MTMVIMIMHCCADKKCYLIKWWFIWSVALRTMLSSVSQKVAPGSKTLLIRLKTAHHDEYCNDDNDNTLFIVTILIQPCCLVALVTISQKLAPGQKTLLLLLTTRHLIIIIVVVNIKTILELTKWSNWNNFSDKSRFGYFFRVVPSDYFQAKVLHTNDWFCARKS